MQSLPRDILALRYRLGVTDIAAECSVALCCFGLIPSRSSCLITPALKRRRRRLERSVPRKVGRPRSHLLKMSCTGSIIASVLGVRHDVDDPGILPKFHLLKQYLCCVTPPRIIYFHAYSFHSELRHSCSSQ
jgi:hypothetical protein